MVSGLSEPEAARAFADYTSEGLWILESLYAVSFYEDGQNGLILAHFLN